MLKTFLALVAIFPVLLFATAYLNFINIDTFLDDYSLYIWIIVFVLFMWGSVNMPTFGEKDARFKTGFKDNDTGDPGNPVKGCALIFLALVYVFLGFLSIDG